MEHSQFIEDWGIPIIIFLAMCLGFMIGYAIRDLKSQEHDNI